ncbi:MAG: zinc ribbon domain-containing protein [Vallitaleaceae bacterium]|jgi:hypothetical protein|nr:zinc ribbon domain-containing protein [Vallitaleaceae bacterium]
MYCSSCGTKMDKGTKFCQFCGTPAENSNDDTALENNLTGSYHQQAPSVRQTATNNPSVQGNLPHKDAGSYNGAIAGPVQKKNGCLKGCLIGIVALVGVSILGIVLYLVIGSVVINNMDQRDYYARGDMPVIETDDEMTVGNTMIIIRQLSEMYVEASELTGSIYTTDPTVTSYDDWKDDLDEAMDLWNQIEDYSDSFSELLDDADYKTGLELDLHFGSTAYAYTKEEVTAFYDNAPRGTGKKRIELLAENLGVSAAKAFAILEMSDNQLASEAWNNAGDTFETLEQGATAIKAVSDVAVAVGAAVATGGTVGTVSLVGKGVAIIKNADLVLGVTGDMAFVIMGEDSENNAIVTNINAIKSYTGVVASIDDLICIDTDNISDVAIYTVKGLNDYLQNDQVLGIDLSDTDQQDETLKVSLLGSDDIGDYVDDNNIEVRGLDELTDAYDNSVSDTGTNTIDSGNTDDSVENTEPEGTTDSVENSEPGGTSDSVEIIEPDNTDDPVDTNVAEDYTYTLMVEYTETGYILTVSPDPGSARYLIHYSNSEGIDNIGYNPSPWVYTESRDIWIEVEVGGSILGRTNQVSISN